MAAITRARSQPYAELRPEEHIVSVVGMIRVPRRKVVRRAGSCPNPALRMAASARRRSTPAGSFLSSTRPMADCISVMRQLVPKRFVQPAKPGRVSRWKPPRSSCRGPCRTRRAPTGVAVGGEHAAFAAGGDDLVLAEGEGADVADRAHRSPFVACAVSLRAVLDHVQAMLLRGRSRIWSMSHGQPAKMHRDDRLWCAASEPRDGLGGDVLAVAIDVGKHRRGAPQRTHNSRRR